jgi:hypothetical protein
MINLKDIIRRNTDMNRQLDTCFDRVEKALGTLIDSITKYNPSTIQVQQLGDANAELTRGFQDCMLNRASHKNTDKYAHTIHIYRHAKRRTLHAAICCLFLPIFIDV